MSTLAMPDTLPPRSRAFALGLLLLGSAGAAAAWALVAVALDRQCAWMAVLAAVDAVLLLRLAKVPRGLGRVLLAVTATALAIVLANWWIAGSQVGQMVGLLPWQAIPRLGWAHARTLLELANHGVDFAWYGIGLVVAGVGARLR